MSMMFKWVFEGWGIYTDTLQVDQCIGATGNGLVDDSWLMCTHFALRAWAHQRAWTDQRPVGGEIAKRTTRGARSENEAQDAQISRLRSAVDGTGGVFWSNRFCRPHMLMPAV